MADSIHGRDDARPSDSTTTSPTVPPRLEAGAQAFQLLLGQVRHHVDQTPQDAEDFDFIGGIRIVLDTFRSLDTLGQLGFFMALGEYLVMVKGAGEPYDDFLLDSLGRWHEVATQPTAGAPFTPGPWHVNGDRSIGSPSGTICETYSHMGLEEADANERLIAAAPDLYEALTDLLDQVQQSPGGHLFLTGLATKALHFAREGRQ